MNRIALIPVYNESRTVGSVVLKAASFVETVLVVDDGSTDDTADIAERAGARVVRHDENRGKGAAVRTGLTELDTERHDVCVLLDGDGQHDPGLIPDLCAPIEAGRADFVVGNRSRPGDGEIPSYRRLGRSVLDGFTNAFLSSPVQDTQSGFRAFSTDYVADLLPDQEGFGLESEMLYRAADLGMRVEEVTIDEHYPDTATPTQSPVRHGLAIVLGLLRISREEHPLLVFGVSGLTLLVIGVLFGVQTATHYYATSQFWPGKAMLSMLFSIVGMQLFMGGLLMDYL
jgi:glycosyltransferase involved in cell wall biosynthesis